MDNKLKFDQRSINPPYQTFPQVGSYFMLLTYAHQPAWCSYSLHELKSAWDKVGGIITNSDGEVLYCKEPIGSLQLQRANTIFANTFC